MKTAEPDAPPATEMLHFLWHSRQGTYGVPRWVGNLMSVVGRWKAEYINFQAGRGIEGAQTILLNPVWW